MRGWDVRGWVRRARTFCGEDPEETLRPEKCLKILLVVQIRKGLPGWWLMRVLSPVGQGTR